MEAFDFNGIIYRLTQMWHSLITAVFQLFLLFNLIAFSGFSHANNYHSLEALKKEAKLFLEEMQVPADKTKTEVKIGSIDPRLRLQQCAEPLNLFLPQTNKVTGKTTVGVRCANPVKWKIYIPAEVVIYQSAWVLTRNIGKGDLITSADLVERRIAVKNNRRVPILNLKQIINTSPKRAMRAGNIIYQDSICLVCRGEKVSVTAQNRFININLEGVALVDAVLGEFVQIQNKSSRKVFDAKVTGKNQVMVSLAETQ